MDDGHDVDHPQRPSAHGGDVVHVHEDGEVSGVVRVRVDERLHYPVSGEQHVLVADIYGRRILPLRGYDLRERRRGQEVHDLVDGVLPRHAGITANGFCN